jgi:hypothetical protein
MLINRDDLGFPPRGLISPKRRLGRLHEEPNTLDY